ncbi:MAG: hypothetical protein ACREVI_10995 [Steroidobacteraceae bacterium]
MNEFFSSQNKCDPSASPKMLPGRHPSNLIDRIKAACLQMPSNRMSRRHPARFSEESGGEREEAMPQGRVLFNKVFQKHEYLYHQNQAGIAALKICAKLRRASGQSA